MKISGNKPPESLEAARLHAAGKKAPGRPGGTPADADKVDLSAGSREIAETIRLVRQIPEVRTEKVNAIRERIASGDYSADPVKVAQRMIDEIV